MGFRGSSVLQRGSLNSRVHSQPKANSVMVSEDNYLLQGKMKGIAVVFFGLFQLTFSAEFAVA